MKRLMVSLVLSLICLSSLAVGQLTGILTQEMLEGESEVFFVRGNFTLGGATVTVPAGKVLVFTGGSLDGGEIVGTETSIRMLQTRPAFGLDLVISGTWNVPEVHDGWFVFDESEGVASNRIIKNILAFSNDATPCHIFFDEKRIYYFEMPYKGRADIGEMVTYRMVNGQKKRNYSDIFTKRDEYDFLRIFTIPSNTHLTINSTLKMLPTGLGAYFVFWEEGKENITIDGHGTVSGDNDWHRYDTPYTNNGYYGEWGHIFKFVRCSNIVFKDITVSDSFGDCIIVSGSVYPDETKPRWASGFTLENVKILRARRNGVAIGAKDVVIRGCHFEDCGSEGVKGAPPRSAIDFEPDDVQAYPEIGNENVLMEDCTFAGNYFDVASYLNNLSVFGKTATTVKRCKFTSSIKIQGTYWMRFEDCYIPFVYNNEDKRSVMLYSKYMEFVNCIFGEYDTSVLNRASNSTNKFVDCKFNVEKK